MGQVSKKWQKCSMVHLHVHLPSIPSFLLSLPYFAIPFSPSPLPMQIQIFFADIRKSVWEKLELLCQAFMSAKGTRRWLSAACTWRCSYGTPSQWRYGGDFLHHAPWRCSYGTSSQWRYGTALNLGAHNAHFSSIRGVLRLKKPVKSGWIPCRYSANWCEC